jgi:hypothetical protein
MYVWHAAMSKLLHTSCLPRVTARIWMRLLVAGFSVETWLRGADARLLWVSLNRGAARGCCR